VTDLAGLFGEDLTMETHVGSYVVAALGFHGDAMDCAGDGIRTIDYSSVDSTVYSCWDGWQAAVDESIVTAPCR
jgi:hypothetical protein